MVNEGQLSDLVTLIAGTAAMLMMTLALVTFAFVFQRKLIKKQQAYQQIEKTLQKQELKSAYLLIEGREVERKRIAEDLHDNLGSILATLRLYSDLLVEKNTDPETKRLAERISLLTEQTATEARRISHNLSAGAIEQAGLKPPVEQLCEAIRQSHRLQIDTSIDVTTRLSGEITLNVYRIIQELFTNTLKHARATHVRLEISEIKGDYLSLIFEDNGIGFDASQPATGIGLQTIRARLDRIQGSLTIDASKNKGTTAIIEVNLKS